MPTFTIRIPDGRTVTIRANAPDVAVADAESWAHANPKPGGAVADAHAYGQRQGAGQGVIDTLNRSLPGLSEAGAGLETGGRAVDQLLRGQPVDLGADWAASRGRQQGSLDQLQQDHPIVAAQTRGVGLALPVAAALFTGGASAAPSIARIAAPTGLKAAAKTIGGRLARNAITGAAVGGVYGASQPGTLGERGANATAALIPGAILGAATPEIASGVAAGGRRVARTINAITGRAPPAAPAPIVAPAAAVAPDGAQARPVAPAAAPAPPVGPATVSPTPGAAGSPPPPPAAAPPQDLPRSVTSLSPVQASALDKFVRVAKPDVNAMTSKTAAYSDVGIPPTLVDTGGRSGQSVVRALSSRPGGALDAVESFANQRRFSLASRVSGQARDIVSSDPRTPDDIAQAIEAARTEQGNRQFGAVRADPVVITKEMADALESHYGQAAIREAANRSTDPLEAAALNELADHVKNTGVIEGANLNIGQVQGISDVLYKGADAAADQGKARAMKAFGATIRDGGKIQNPAYEKALSDFADASALADAPKVGAGGLTQKTDEFLANIRRVAEIPGTVDEAGVVGEPQGLNLARAGYRRAIESATGHSGPGAVMGVAERLAYAPEYQSHNAALLGDEGAGRLQNAMTLETGAVRNAANASPAAGSNTFLNQIAGGMTSGEIAGHAAETAASVAGLAHGNVGPVAMQGLKAVLRGQAFTDEEADALSRLAIDPAHHQAVLDYIASKAGPQAAQQFSTAVQQTFGGATAAAATPATSTQQPNAIDPGGG